MKHLIPALMLLLGVLNCHATIGTGRGSQPGSDTAKYANGRPVLNNPELIFTAFDPEAKVSYTLDLGLDMDTFFINAQQDAGTQWFKPVDDGNWATFLSLTNRDKLRWVVMSVDDNGGTAAGQKRLFTTVTQGHEAKLRDWTNQQFTNGIGATAFGAFIDDVNQSGTHATPPNDYTSNGSNVAAATDVISPKAYFGKKSASVAGGDETFNATASGFTAGNLLGQSSWFYYLTRSGPSQLNKVTVDEFDNLGADGYWGFTYVDRATNSPYAGQYLLSYTMEKAGATASTAEGLQRISMTDYLALNRLAPPRYFAASSALAAEYAGYRQGSLVVAAGSMVSAVPEPASWGLMGLGLGLLAVRRRYR